MYKQVVRGSIESPDQSSVALAGGIRRPLVSLPADQNKAGMSCKCGVIIRATKKL